MTIREQNAYLTNLPYKRSTIDQSRKNACFSFFEFPSQILSVSYYLTYKSILEYCLSQEPGNSQFSGQSTEYSGKEKTEKEEGRKTGTSEVSNSLISRKFPADNFCQSLLTEILQRLLLPHLDRHRKRQKLTEVEASTPFQPIR
ncbi:Protein CBG03717 [Caenorhabditis briggsae]|uniref:Protein CBG03717 n=1 Tax=Caenorhabditis briggsae TaxID=6238 RepID=A8WWJ3_CAEBR|nr:Protein CBG03717 [Caenorhabditis briggsae]CAP24565.1 Protein CBG03717 [Caenorhabditis briggsae]